MKKLVLITALLCSTAGYALDLLPPPNPDRWPMSKVSCVTVDIDPADSQWTSMDCTQVWFDDSDKCYYDHTMVRDDVAHVWRTVSRTIVRFPYSEGAYRCSIDTHPIPPPASSKRRQ